MKDTFAAEFPLDEPLIHLNHAAVAPWPRRTVEAINRFAQENLHQGSWRYAEWLEVESGLRGQIARLINAGSPQEIALVKNTSEALSFVAAGIDWAPGENIVITDQEFPSNRIVWESLADQGVGVRQASLNSGQSPEDAIFAQVDAATRFIAVSSVQYASGLRLDLQQIGDYCRDNNILFCVDAIQGVGAVEFDVRAIHADFAAADGHKWLLGPEGLGFFYVRPQLLEGLRLTQFGWHMVEAVGDFDRKDWQPAATARRFECGSPNMLAIHALSASLSLLHEVGIGRVSERVRENSRYLFERLGEIPGVELVTPTSEGRYAGIVSFRIRGTDSVTIQRRLHQAQVFCACRDGAVRFSPHFYTSKEMIDAAILRLILAIN